MKEDRAFSNGGRIISPSPAPVLLDRLRFCLFLFPSLLFLLSAVSGGILWVLTGLESVEQVPVWLQRLFGSGNNRPDIANLIYLAVLDLGYFLLGLVMVVSTDLRRESMTLYALTIASFSTAVLLHLPLVFLFLSIQ